MGSRLKIETLEQTRAFYNWELKKESLTEKERASYLLAKKSIEKIIQEKRTLQGAITKRELKEKEIKSDERR